MLENVFLPILTGVVTLILIITITCLFDDMWEFLAVAISLPILWIIGKVVLLLIDKLF